VGTRADLEVVAKRKIHSLCRESKSTTPVIQLPDQLLHRTRYHGCYNSRVYYINNEIFFSYIRLFYKIVSVCSWRYILYSTGSEYTDFVKSEVLFLFQNLLKCRVIHCVKHNANYSNYNSCLHRKFLAFYGIRTFTIMLRRFSYFMLSSAR
jgi:hypothetical protein